MLFTVTVATCAVAGDPSKPQPKVVPLTARDYQEILSGPPESIRMQSGYVVLEPTKSVGKHSTGHHEELLVVLEGRGEMVLADGTKLAVTANSAIYCPPQTEHDVTNTGSGQLRYVYVVADTR